MNLIKRLFCVGLCVAAWPIFAQDVSLTSRDGAIHIDGMLLSYDGEFYRVETIYGPLTLDGEGVTCEGVGCPDLTAFIAEVTFSGTRRMADVLIPALIQAFASRNQLQLTREVESDTASTFVLRNAERVVARFGLRATSTSEGFADLIAEEADIAMVLREPSATEITMARDSGAGTLVKGRRARVVALDGIVAIVALDQPVKTLSLEQLAEAFSGEAQSWAAFGGADVPVVVKAPPGNVGLSEAFERRVMRPFGKSVSEDLERFPSLEELADTVADDSFALGLTTLSEVGNADPVGLSGGCGFEQWPSLATLRSEDYPLTLPLMLYTPARRLPLIAREFLEFASSPAAHVVIRRAGFVDQSITRTDFNDQGDRLAQAILRAGPEIPLEELQRLVDELRNRERLSTTFRFEAGTRLDVQSSENIFRLARAMETGAFDGKSLLFAGFSDGEGPATPNKALALERARLVLDLVRDAAQVADFSQVDLSAVAFGEALPMACDNTDWGRAINRRVEVWIR